VDDRSDTLMISLVLPIHNQADHVSRIVAGYLNVMRHLNVRAELILVANGCTDGSPEMCRYLEESHKDVHAFELRKAGWGHAVRTGLANAHGDVVGYTNSARTSPEILALMLAYARAYPKVVLKANRRIRDSVVRRAGSLLYNVECRTLFNMPTWDVNGTPKLFPRSFGKLLELHGTRDLIDAEFMLVCQRERYPIIEVPLLTTTRLGGRSATNYRSAARMYRGAVALRLHETRA
jgi:glycosyltransferase involved in cell wall biosynthesis